MSRMTAGASLLAAVLWAVGTRYASAEPKTDPAELKVGSHVELTVKETAQGNRPSSTVYLGKVKTVTSKSVTLQDATKTIKSESSTPVLGSIPYVKRYFRSVGVGQSQMGKRAVVIPLDDIARIEAVTVVEFRKRNGTSKRGVLVR